jgi:hypothetical protein
MQEAVFGLLQPVHLVATLSPGALRVTRDPPDEILERERNERLTAPGKKERPAQKRLTILGSCFKVS